MSIEKIEPFDFSSNSYIIRGTDGRAIVVDPSVQAARKCAEEGIKVAYVLLTHGHFDHVSGCAMLQKAGAEIICGAAEEPLIFSEDYLSIFGGVEVPPFTVSKTVNDGDELCLCGIDFKVMSAPGHTAGSVVYIADEVAFTGDLLFKGSAGRWDLPTGDFLQLKNSLKKLCSFNKNYSVMSGHGEDTTLEAERRSNPFLSF